MLKLLLFSFFLTQSTFSASTTLPCNKKFKPNLEKGCEGEVCFCEVTWTKNPKANKSVDIFSKPDFKSIKITVIKKGEHILKATPYLKKDGRGVGEFLFAEYIEGGKITLKKGQKVEIIQYLSEGYYEFCYLDKFYSSDSLKVIKKHKAEEWLQVELTDGRKGWTRGRWSFNFREGCG